MANENIINAMKERFNGCPLFEGRTKGDWDDIVGCVVSINDFFKLTGDDGEYFAITLDGDNDKFYLSGGAVTDLLATWGDDAKGVEFTVGAKVKTKGNKTYRPITIK